jgi:hypothetical protein
MNRSDHGRIYEMLEGLGAGACFDFLTLDANLATQAVGVLNAELDFTAPCAWEPMALRPRGTHRVGSRSIDDQARAQGCLPRGRGVPRLLCGARVEVARFATHHRHA